jgi:uncharacterized protein
MPGRQGAYSLAVTRPLNFGRWHSKSAAVILRVKVKPNSRRSSLTQEADGSWLALVKAPPIDGRANAELVTLVAEHFGCRKSAVRIRSGASGRIKLVSVEA